MKSINDFFRKPKDDDEKELFTWSAEWISTLEGGCQANQSWCSTSIDGPEDHQRMKEDIQCDECPINCDDIKEMDRKDWYSLRNVYIRFCLADLYLWTQAAIAAEILQGQEESHVGKN